MSVDTLDVLALRISYWRERMGFVTPVDISNSQADEDVLLVTGRDYMLACVGQALIEYMNAVHAIGKEDHLTAIHAFGDFLDELHSVQCELHATDFEKPHAITHRQAMYGKLALIAEEAGEAAEKASRGDEKGFWEEMADIVVRVLEVAGTAHRANNVRFGSVFGSVLRRNEDRPIRHGKPKYL